MAIIDDGAGNQYNVDKDTVLTIRGGHFSLGDVVNFVAFAATPTAATAAEYIPCSGKAMSWCDVGHE